MGVLCSSGETLPPTSSGDQVPDRKDRERTYVNTETPVTSVFDSLVVNHGTFHLSLSV